nr:MAG TPA: hypothetical protein [Caudoviricetes sp.]
MYKSGSRTPFKRSRSIRYIGLFIFLFFCLYNTVQAVFNYLKMALKWRSFCLLNLSITITFTDVIN